MEICLRIPDNASGGRCIRPPATLNVESFRSRGTVKGRVEKLNLHERREFTLFAPIGDIAIPCTFEEELFSTVRLAIRQNVTVTGMLSFNGDSSYPSRIQVEEIEIHPPDDQLPTLRSLFGVMPGATGGKPAAERGPARR